MHRVSPGRPLLVALATLFVPAFARAQAPTAPAVAELPKLYAGTVVDFATGTAATRWYTSDPDVAWTDGRGHLVLGHEGRVTISRVIGADSVARELVVMKNPAVRVDLSVDASFIAGQPAQVRAVALDRDGRPLPDVPVAIAASGASVRTAENGTALVAPEPGPVSVIAQTGGAAASVTVAALPAGVVQQGSAATAPSRDAAAGAVRRLVLRSDASDLVTVGDTVRLRVDAWGLGGRRVSQPPVAFAVLGAGSGVATVTPRGQFVATQPGTYVVLAASGTYADRQTIFVAAHR